MSSPLVRVHAWVEGADGCTRAGSVRRWEGARDSRALASTAALAARLLATINSDSANQQPAYTLYASVKGMKPAAAVPSSASSVPAALSWQRVESDASWAPFLAHAAAAHGEVVQLKLVLAPASASGSTSAAAPVTAPVPAPRTPAKPFDHTARTHITKSRFRGDWRTAAAAQRQAKGNVVLPPVILERPAASASTSDAAAALVDEDDEWVSVDEGQDEPGSRPVATPAAPSTGVAASTLPPALLSLLSQNTAAAPSSGPASITFTVNGQSVTLLNPDPTLLLAPFLREQLCLTGTKIGCGEGGCGACTVLIAWSDPLTGALVQRSTNACLHLVAQMDGMSVTTIEGLGSTREGLHPIQASIVENAATQCGYCTPGMAMSMYGLLCETNENGGSAPTVQQIEDRFDGNICRCTGYRPIFKAMRAVVTGMPGKEESQQQAADHKLEQKCASSSSSSSKPKALTPCGKGSGASCSSSAKGACNDRGITCGFNHGSCGRSEPGDMEDLIRFDAGNPKHLIPQVLPSRSASSSAAAATKKGRCGAVNASASSCSSSAPSPFPSLRSTWSSSSPGSGVIFISPASVADVQSILGYYSSLSTPVPVKLVTGNTSIGVIKYYPFNAEYDAPGVVVNVARLSELLGITQQQGVGMRVGSSVPIAAIIAALESSLTTLPSSFTAAWPALIRHLGMIASTGIRNVGSLIGNLMIAKAHPAFPSDPLTLLSALGATLELSGQAGVRSIPVSSVQSAQFLPSELITSFTIPYSTPPPGGQQVFDSWKTRARHQLAHPIVNGAFLFTLSPPSSSSSSGVSGASGPPVIQSASMAFGGLPCSAGTGVFLAPKTCSSLVGQSLTASTMSVALGVLAAEIVPSPSQVAARKALGMRGAQLSDPAYLQSLALVLLYKFFLGLFGSGAVPGFTLPARDASGYMHYVRGLSSGVETYSAPSDPSLAPVGLPLPKIEAPIQSTGEARYTNDEPFPSERGLHGSLVYSSQATGTITSIDASVAVSMPGVVRFISAADIPSLPGRGSSGGASGGFNDCGSFPGDEEIFASTSVATCGQSIGMVLADTQEHAHAAARAVVVTYAPNAPKPLVSLEDAIAANSFMPDLPQWGQVMPGPVVCGDLAAGFAASAKVVSATLQTGGQYHFSMETQSSYAVPSDTGNGALTIICSSQGSQDVRSIVSHALNTPANNVVALTRRAGGAFGAKLSRNHPLACAVAIAATIVNRPVKSQCDRMQDMEMWGKRPVVYTNYKIGFNADGKVVALETLLTQQGGHSYETNFGIMNMALNWLDNAYNIANFSASGRVARTNTPSNTSMRGPGALKAIAAMENILERVAFETGLSPNAVREANFYTDGQVTPYGQMITDCRMQQVWAALKLQANYDATAAQVAEFNAANRWRKRGVHMSAVKYGITDTGVYDQSVMVLTVCPEDGSISCMYNGAEMGQGINSKVVASLAMELGKVFASSGSSGGTPLDMSLIRIADSPTSVISNGAQTGGSSTSEVCCAVAIMAAGELVKRLAPVLAANPSISSWPALIAAAVRARVNLQVSSLYFTADPSPNDPFTYFVWAGACSHVEIDVLTGEVQVLAVDIVYDCGQSLNPLVDVGQIEGGFLMGLGAMLLEEVVHDPTSGVQLTAGTWEYHVASSQDIPIAFNVSLLPNSSNSSGVLNSKATAEPPVMLSVSAFLAVKDCIAAARADAGHTEWFDIPTPATTERVQLACCVTPDTLVL